MAPLPHRPSLSSPLRLRGLFALTLCVWALPAVARVLPSPPSRPLPSPPPAATSSAVAPAPVRAASTAACDGASSASDRVRVLVLDLKASAERTDLAAALSQVVAAEAAHVPGFQLLSIRDVQAAVAQEASRQLLGCDDDDGCLAEIADAADATLVVHGTLGATPDGAPLVTLTLLNTRALVVVNRVAFGWPGDPVELPAVVAAAAQVLVLDKRERPPGSIELLGVPDDARVVVDGVDHTAEHRAGAIAGVPIGPHAVEVVADGKLPAVVHVVVKRGQASAARVVLEDAPIAGLWLWAGGAAVATVGVAATLGVAWATARGDVTAIASVPAWTLNDVERLRGAP